MIDYNKIISKWQNDVAYYCARHNIPNMELHNLRMGDLYNYDLYDAYKQVKSAIAAHRATPASKLHANELLTAIKQWYILASNSKMQKISMRMMTNSVFAYFIGRTK